jgi:hypothetical protein
MRAVTLDAIANQLAEIRRVASVLGVKVVTPRLEQAAQEALAVAQNEQEADLAREVLAAARQAGLGCTVTR